jgi:hypothetical protein
MLTLHIDPDCSDCETLVALAKRRRLAVTIDTDCDHAGPHCVTEGDQTRTGHEQAREVIEDRAAERQKAHRLAGDYCYDFGEGVEGTGGCG